MAPSVLAVGAVEGKAAKFALQVHPVEVVIRQILGIAPPKSAFGTCLSVRLTIWMRENWFLKMLMGHVALTGFSGLGCGELLTSWQSFCFRSDARFAARDEFIKNIVE